MMGSNEEDKNMRQLKVNDKLFQVNMDNLSAKSDYFKALFNPLYSDSQQQIIHIKDIVNEEEFNTILDFCQTEKLEFPEDLSDLCNLMVKAQTLAVDDLVKKCLPELSKRMRNSENTIDFLEILSLSETVHIPDIREYCVTKVATNFDVHDRKEFSSYNFSDSTIEAILDFPQLTTSIDSSILDFVRELNIKDETSKLKLLKKVVQNQKMIMKERLWIRNLLPDELMNQTTTDKFKALENLSTENLTQNDLKEIETSFNTNFRFKWPYLMFLGMNVQAPGNKKKFNCHSFNTRLNKLDIQFSFDGVEGLESYNLKGSSISSVCDGFILVGGEFKYGKNNWNLDINKFTYADKSFKKIGTLPGPRRHHTALLDGDQLYLLGGFNSTRVMLSDMIVMDLSTGDMNCVDLPHRGYNIAANFYKGKIVVVLNGGIYLYSPESQSWLQRIVRPESIPANVEFHHAFCFQDILYLTCNFNKSVYRIDLSSNDYELREVGKLTYEAERPCSYGPYLYNVCKSDILDFEGTGEKVIEKLNMITGESEILHKFENPTPVQDLPLFWRVK